MSGNRSKLAFFDGGRVGHFERRFQREGASPTNHCWCQKTRVIAVSCGFKIFAVRCLVLSQYTHLTDGRMDGQNCDSNTVRCITCSRTVKRLNGLQLEMSLYRRYASAVLAVIVCLSVRPSVCLSLCLSQVGVVQRWLNVGSD